MIDVSYDKEYDEWVFHQVDVRTNDHMEVARLTGSYCNNSFDALAYFKETVFGKLNEKPFIERAMMKCLFKV